MSQLSMKAEVAHSAEEIGHAQQKILPFDEVARKWQRQSGLLFTKGAFDILHCGHLALFSYMGNLRASMEAAVAVGILSDAYIKRVKGASRPIQTSDDRCLQIALLAQVDLVFVVQPPDLSTVLETLRPAVYVKGQDTALGEQPKTLEVELRSDLNPELAALRAYGGKMIVFRDDGRISTTSLLAKVGRLNES